MDNLFTKFQIKSDTEIIKELRSILIKSEKRVLVTANTEIIDYVIKVEKDLKLMENLKSDHSIIVADGVGIQKFLKKRLNYNVTRYPGVDIITDLLPILDENNLKLCTLGGSLESLLNFKKYIKINYPQIKIIGQQSGYITETKMNEFLKEMSSFKPDLILVGLGVPKQERIIFENFANFDKGLFIGCGGSMDVLGGTKKRAPLVFQKLKIEWLYRIIREPKRIPKFISTQISFIKNVKRKV